MLRAVFLLILCLTWAQRSMGAVGFCDFIVPTCEPETCCNGTYILEMYNSDPDDDVQVQLRVRIWNCVHVSASCSSLPTGAPDVEYCQSHTIPANTDCSDPDLLNLGSIQFACNCSGTNGTGTHVVDVQMWPTCTPSSCSAIESECAGYVDHACARRDNQICRWTQQGLICCCD